MHDDGATVPEIKEQLEKMAGTLHNYILIGKLEQLYKGGRMSGVPIFPWQFVESETNCPNFNRRRITSHRKSTLREKSTSILG